MLTDPSYVMFEVVAGIIAGVITAPAGGAGAAGLVLAKWGPKFMNIMKFLKTKVAKLAASLGNKKDEVNGLQIAIDKSIDGMGVARAGKWCFAAGTVIMTLNGPMAIEQVQAGQYVYSAHEETGEFGIRPVMETYINEADEVFRIHYTTDGSAEGGDTASELVATGEHPFWNDDTGSFVPARSLEPGTTLRLMSGGVGKVASSVAERAPPGRKIKVYNFAVADHHTYFAGPGGVWVHNVCGALLDEYASFFKTRLDDLAPGGNPTPAQWDAAFDDVLQKLRVDKARVPEDEIGDVVGHILTNPPLGVPKIGTLNNIAENVFESRLTGLIYGVDRRYGNRVKHVLRHADDQPGRANVPHGVFDSGRKGFLKTVDEAWLLKNSDSARIVDHTTSIRNGETFESMLIDMGRRIGYEGGQIGAANGHRAANHVRIVVKNGNEIITAYPEVL